MKMYRYIYIYIYTQLHTQGHGFTNYTGAISCEALIRGPPLRVGAMKLGSVKSGCDDMRTCGLNHRTKKRERKSSS